MTGDKSGVGHELDSRTENIIVVRVQYPGSDVDVVLVDTPGFNNTDMSDVCVLEMIAEWLKDTYVQVLFRLTKFTETLERQVQSQHQTLWYSLFPKNFRQSSWWITTPELWDV